MPHFHLSSLAASCSASRLESGLTSDTRFRSHRSEITKSVPEDSDILYLISDMNFFIQCRASDEINWCEVGSFCEIHQIICLPVILEIDIN